MLHAYVHQFDGAISLGTLPLAAGMIVASAKTDPVVRAGFEFAITTDRTDPDELLASYDDPAVVAMSCYPWNLRYSLTVARRVKERFPGCTVVLGGQAIPWSTAGAMTFMAEHPAVDLMVIGEGEITFRELLAARLSGSDLSQVDGLVLRKSDAPGGLTRTRPRDRMGREQLAAEPSPFLDGTLEPYMLRRGRLYRALLETNRRCPFSCTFCVWGQKDQCRIHEFPASRVEGELEWIAAHRFPHLYLVDANFGMMKRDFETVRQVVRARERHGFPESCYLNLTKNVSEKTLEVYDILRKGGIHCQVELSMQDTSRHVLAAVKRFNISEERSLRLRRRCHELGLSTYNELIIGLPTQTLDSFCDTVAGALSPVPEDAFWVYACRVVENSEMARSEYRAAHGIVTRACVMVPSDPEAMNEGVADYEEIVVATSTMPIDDWRVAYGFGNLAMTLCSMRLVDMVARYMRFTLGADLGAFFRALQRRAHETRTCSSGEGSGLASLGRVLDRYTSALLDGKPLLIAVEAAGPTRWQIREALLIEGIRHYDQLIDDVAAVTRELIGRTASAEAELIDELFRYQRFATPTFERRTAEQQRFTTDWLTYQRDGGAPVRRDTTLRYRPPRHLLAARSFAAFVGKHVFSIYNERVGACISRVDAGPHKAS